MSILIFAEAKTDGQIFSSIKDLGNYVIMHNMGANPIQLNAMIQYQKIFLLHELTVQ